MAESNETAAIVALYGEVDRAVNAEPLLRIPVAQLLSPYREEPDLHWYEDFLKWLGETPGESAFPTLEGTLNSLGQTRPRPRALARRMFAIAVAARAFPALKEDPEQRTLAINALTSTADAADSGADPEGLYKFLAGEEPVHTDAIPGTDAWWTRVVEKAVEAKVAAVGAIGMYPKPCTGWWVTVPGTEGPVDALRTEHEPEGIEFMRAVDFLEPVNWEECRPDFWCKVEQLADLGEGQRRYREVVSTHCADKGSRGFWAATELLFNFMWVPAREGAQAAVANYQLAEPPREGDLIVIDEGTLVVAATKDPKKLLVTTTKRIRFSREFVPGAIAMIMCALGYGDVSNDLLVCAARQDENAPAGTNFPGVPVNVPAAAAAARAGGPRGGADGAPLRGFAQESADIWTRFIRDGARAFERSLGAAGRQSTREPRGRRRD